MSGNLVWALTGAAPLLPSNDHDITVFLFDQSEWNTPWWNPFPLRSDTPTGSCILSNRKPFIALPYYAPRASDTNLLFIHELMHAYTELAGVADHMDTYFLNATPDAINGNFAIQWNLLTNWLNLMPPQTPTNPITTNSLDKWGLVPQLETLAETFLQLCLMKGSSLKITQGLRTMAQQQALYDQGRIDKTKPIVTNAKPGQSQHNFGKAFDVAFTGTIPYPTDDKVWKAIADIGVALGLTAGYYFKSFQDKPHFQID